MFQLNIRRKVVAAAVATCALLGRAGTALAVNIDNTGLKDTSQMIYGDATPTNSIGTTIGAILNGFLGLLGIIFVVLTIYAGFTWMTAGGNQEKIKKAQQTMTAAVIGMVLIMGAWAISDFVVGFIVNVALTS